ncbi:MAG: ABC transporter permease [Candidatus Methanoplasma sp.]|jgi:ABC-2 type transport system permease protein|nr:ABC transporter permease [Candidatus Methanoplasma sp.]
MYIELDDFRQSYVVAKNEIRKFLRGRRFIIYILLTVLAFSLLTSVSYFYEDRVLLMFGNVVSLYLFFMQILIIVAAILFASVVIVSEFEERTALVLFTRPIKKTSIFIGKMVGCIVLETVMIVVYYLGVAAAALFFDGHISEVLFVSLGVAFLFILATTGVAILISSIVKKASTSTLLTFAFLLFILSIVSMLFAVSGNDPWFMLDQAANSIGPTVTFEGETLILSEPAKAAGVMAIWGAVTTILAWFAFIKREF